MRQSERDRDTNVLDKHVIATDIGGGTLHTWKCFIEQSNKTY